MKTGDYKAGYNKGPRQPGRVVARLLILLLLLSVPAVAGFGDCADKIPGMGPDNGGAQDKDTDVDSPGEMGSGDKTTPAESKPAKVVEKAIDIGEGGGEVKLRFIFPKHDNYLERIDLHKSGSAQPFGRVPVGSFINTGDFIVEFRDMNFDGFTDFRIMTDEGERVRSEVYQYWLYEPAARTFAPTNLFDGMCSPSFDPLQQGHQLGLWFERRGIHPQDLHFPRERPGGGPGGDRVLFLQPRLHCQGYQAGGSPKAGLYRDRRRGRTFDLPHRQAAPGLLSGADGGALHLG